MTVFIDDKKSIYDVEPRFEEAFYRFEIEENVLAQKIGQIQVGTTTFLQKKIFI